MARKRVLCFSILLHNQRRSKQLTNKKKYFYLNLQLKSHFLLFKFAIPNNVLLSTLLLKTVMNSLKQVCSKLG